jgi:hypothetical protein
LQIRALLRQNRPFHRANLETNAAVNTGGKINPVPISALGVFARTLINAGDGTSGDAIGNALADVGDNGMGHGFSLKLQASKIPDYRVAGLIGLKLLGLKRLG